jgi:hypothetical protein
MASYRFTTRPSSLSLQPKRPQPSEDDINFQKWLALKNTDPKNNPRFGNVFILRPQAVTQKVQNQHQPANKHTPAAFFKPQPQKASLLQTFANALTRPFANQMKPQNPGLNLTCANCNEPGHNSQSCAKERPAPARSPRA